MTGGFCELVMRSCLAAFVAGCAGCPNTSSESTTQAKSAPKRDDAAVVRLVKILESSTNRDELERTACALAARDDAGSVVRLGEFLRRGEFLARLDDLDNASTKTRHLSAVMKRLAEHPIPQVAELCISLGTEPDFIADDDRKDLLLVTIAAVKPMTKASADFFRAANAEGYFAFNAPLLVRNGSPLALDLFASMMQDPEIPPERRVDCLHTAIVPTRTNLAVLELCARILARTTEERIAIGVIESVFDYQGKKWFGPDRNAPQPVPWKEASGETLAFVAKLAETVKERGELPAELDAAVRQTVMTINDLRPRAKN
jgi:hypothetical protein